ncbi:uncharacterized protein At3g49055-like isoform X1 [Actinidia eriantha]|uniref:uncharacterized protein At3g49055-like isoform X1 n=1 Tax=Actinidia eriantha TaxID=165200 RepID=UPI00258EE8AE|nr:uncharacterized protein At3g49055-like isoform X1 [Actinidia eriantha]
MDATETSSSSDSQIDDGDDLPIDGNKISDELRDSQIENASLIAELEALRQSYLKFERKSAVAEERLALLEKQKDEALKHNLELVKAVEEVSEERNSIRDEIFRLEVSAREREGELERRIDEEWKEKEGIRAELEGSRERIRVLLDEKSEKVRVFSEQLVSLELVKECLVRVIESLDEEKVGIVVDECEEISGETELDEELRAFFGELKMVSKLASTMELKLGEYQEMRKKERRELGNSVVSLTEENRDINSLLRIALVEKEAVEKSLNKLKGNSEQKRVAILQIAERGLQRVGFGFMMGTGTNEPATDNSGANMGNKSDGSECEEEVESLASAVERIMKNLRLEITQLRRSLEESRSDTERLQSLTEKQAQNIAENELYIKELEDREMMLTQNVEELLMEIKETEEEVARWREACELEVTAGKNVVEERDKVVLILKQELEKTKAALDISNGKLKLKEELAGAAMAAQAAAERSLQLADSRAAGLHERIEELTRQLEAADSTERTRRKIRHICWPWRALRANIPPNGTNARTPNFKRMLPEMQALLH